MLLSRRSLIPASAAIRRSNSRHEMQHFLCATTCSCSGSLSNSFLHLFSVPHPLVHNLHGKQNNAFFIRLKTSHLLGVSSPFSFLSLKTEHGKGLPSVSQGNCFGCGRCPCVTISSISFDTGDNGDIPMSNPTFPGLIYSTGLTFNWSEGCSIGSLFNSSALSAWFSKKP